MSAIVQAKVESWEDHVEAWHHFGRVAEGAIWGRAAVASSLKGRYGEGAIERFAAEVGQTPRRLWQLAEVHEAFAGKVKATSLSFQHHAIALAAPDPAAALEKAEAEGWSTRALEEFVRAESVRSAPTSSPASVVADVDDDEDWDCTITLTVPHSALPAVERALRSLGFAGSPTRSRKMKLNSPSALKGAA